MVIGRGDAACPGRLRTIRARDMNVLLGIGAQKAGTSWLHAHLRRNPGIAFPGGKEVHFWDQYRHRGIEWYCSLLGSAGGRVAADITPRYAMLEPEAIREVHACLPDARIMMVIRHPVDRAWSAIRMWMERDGRTPETVDRDWYEAAMGRDQCIERGHYERQLRNWRAFYPADQMLVLRHEDIAGDPHGTIAACCRHAGVPCTGDAAEPALRERVFAGVAAPIPDWIEERLRRHYEPTIAPLSDYLGMDLSRWTR